MNQKTFEKAQELDNRITRLDRAITDTVGDHRDAQVDLPLTKTGHTRVKTVVLADLRRQRAAAQREFARL